MTEVVQHSKHWRQWLCSMAGILLLLGCSEKTADIDPVSMAQDVRVEIGDQSFILPRVAIRRSWRGGKQGYVETPPFDGFEVSINVYGSTGELSQSRQICPLLTRRWSRSICESAYTPLYQSLPRHFALLRPEALSVYRHTHFAGIDQTKYDVVSKIHFKQERASRSCSTPDPSGHRFCSAGVGLKNGLIAVWDAGENPGDDARIAQIVQNFVEKAIGPTESFETLEREAVRLRDPRASCFVDQPYDKETMERVRDYRGLKPCPPRS